mmetsp:Transcript_49796/g.151547  ORF Transcript_49796/g.151547 Transcript_49796/m.151547 type:complete len:221 (-) Transcript_49796:2562-3224(-)
MNRKPRVPTCSGTHTHCSMHDVRRNFNDNCRTSCWSMLATNAAAWAGVHNPVSFKQSSSGPWKPTNHMPAWMPSFAATESGSTARTTGGKEVHSSGSKWTLIKPWPIVIVVYVLLVSPSAPSSMSETGIPSRMSPASESTYSSHASRAFFAFSGFPQGMSSTILKRPSAAGASMAGSASSENNKKRICGSMVLALGNFAGMCTTLKNSKPDRPLFVHFLL